MYEVCEGLDVDFCVFLYHSPLNLLRQVSQLNVQLKIGKSS